MAEKLTIKINGDVKNYKEALKEVESQTSNLSGALSSIAKKSAVAFAGLSSAIVGTVAAYREQEQAELRTKQTLEATGFAAGLTSKEIFKMASSLQKVTTFGDETIISGQNLLLTFRNIGKDVFPEATEVMLDMSTAMGTDLKSSAIQLGKALNDPTTGLSALSRVGITFTEQQKEQIKTMQASGDIAGAQAVIMAELKAQFGGTAKAAAGGTGAFIQLKNNLGDLAEQVGKQLAPALIIASNKINDFVEALKDDGSFARTAATVLAIGTAVTGLVTGATLLAGIFLKVRAIMMATIPLVKAMTLSFRGLAGATGIGLLMILITDLALNWDDRVRQMQNVFQVFTDNMSKLASGLGKLLVGVFTFDLSKLKEGFNQLVDTTIKSFDEIIAKEVEFDKQREAIANKEKERKEKELEDLKTLELEKVRVKQEALEAVKKMEQAKKERDAEEFSAAVDQFRADSEILTEAELEQLQLKEEQLREAKRENDIVTKAQELERKGKHNQAVAMLEEEKNKRIIEANKKRIERERMMNQANLQATQNFIQAGAMLAEDGSETQKNLQVVNAIISTYTAINNALASAPPPANFALAASVGALGFANVARIKGAKFAKGGMFTGGIPGVDSIPAVVQRNEIVAPTKSFDEVVEGTARQRGFVPADEGGGGEPGVVKVILEPAGDFINFIEQKIIEARVQNTGIL